MLRNNVANSERYEGLKSPSERGAYDEDDQKYEKIAKISKASDRATFRFFKWLSHRSGIEKASLMMFLVVFVRFFLRLLMCSLLICIALE